MDGERLLDTNAMIAYLSRNVALRQLVASSPRLLLSTVVLGELCYGAYNSTTVDKNLADIELLVERSTLVVSDAATATAYGQIKYHLRSKGRPIPENDLWLAAIARRFGFVIVSRDKHFSYIDGLFVETW
ncbi:MAG: type II toxin-antitoxin system VapC family toxin [Planctomycetota bacterium]